MSGIHPGVTLAISRIKVEFAMTSVTARQYLELDFGFKVARTIVL
jgi:hypothetical protein